MACELPVFSSLILLLAAAVHCQLATLDPSEINAETNALVSDLLESTPPNKPVVFRLDELTDDLVARASSAEFPSSDEQAKVQYVVNGLAVTDVWSQVIFDPNTGTHDLSLFAAALLGLLPGNFGIDPYPNFLESRQAALDVQKQGRNFTTEILDFYGAVLSRYSSRDEVPFEAAPLYILSYGYQNSTNAQVAGFLEGRCVVFLNLGARNMLEYVYFASAGIHESWHCFQTQEESFPAEPDLMRRTFQEGVVTYLTAVTTTENITDTALLFWTKEELAAAEERKTEILLAFESDRASTDPAILSQYYNLGVPLSEVPGAPSRSGYYVALLAYRTYVDNYPVPATLDTSELPKFLLDVTDSAEGREEIWQVLAARELGGRQDDSGALDEASSATQNLGPTVWWVASLLVVPSATTLQSLSLSFL